MKRYCVTFYCKPGDHWRCCSEIVIAKDAARAVKKVKRKNYDMPVNGPYRVEEI